MPESTQPIVNIKKVTFYRQDKKIFDNMSIQIPPGKIIGIMGPSGCGKTTLLRLIGGQLRPEQGEVDVMGVDIYRLRRKALYRLRRHMGMLFQSSALFTNVNVFENVAFPLREHTNLPESIIHDLVLMKLQAVGLRGARNLMPTELSGGMGRRVALARAVALDPELVLYDEPFVGLDPISKGVIVKLIKELSSALHLTSVIVSHDVPETFAIADYIYIIADAKVIGEGTPAQLKAETKGLSHQFIEGLPDGVVPFHYPATEYMADIMM